MRSPNTLLITLAMLVVAAQPGVEAEQQPTASDTCGSCHREIYGMWKESAHATTMDGSIFLSAYRDIETRKSLAGVCLTCHAPMAGVIGDTDLSQRISWEGVTCDFCHSLVSVDVSGGTARHVVDVGDVKRGPIRGATSMGHEVEYSELFTRSIVCAPCHEFSNPDGTPIMTTYSEWKSSQAAERGQSCQSCHMNVVEANVVDPRVKRDARSEVNLHAMPGGHSLEQLHKALGVSIRPNRNGDDLSLSIELTNRGAGHAVPTGMPGRRIVLELEVATSDGQSFDDLRTYGKYFQNAEGKTISHVADYFGRGVRLESDTRIGVDEVRVESFRFPVPAAATAFVTLKLHYEHAPRGPDEERTWITFLAERRVVRPVQ